MSKRLPPALLAALLLLGAAGLAWAQVSPNYDNRWRVVSAGGMEWAASDEYMAHGTVSQFAIGPAAGIAYGVGQGYWYGIPTGSRLYLPLIMRSAAP